MTTLADAASPLARPGMSVSSLSLAHPDRRSTLLIESSVASPTVEVAAVTDIPAADTASARRIVYFDEESFNGQAAYAPIRPRMYLLAMWRILVSAFTKPLSTTVIDLDTGEVFDKR